MDPLPYKLSFCSLHAALRPAASFQTEVVLLRLRTDASNSADSRLKLDMHRNRNIVNIQLRAKSTLRTLSACKHESRVPADI